VAAAWTDEILKPVPFPFKKFILDYVEHDGLRDPLQGAVDTFVSLLEEYTDLILRKAGGEDSDETRRVSLPTE